MLKFVQFGTVDHSVSHDFLSTVQPEYHCVEFTESLINALDSGFMVPSLISPNRYDQPPIVCSRTEFDSIFTLIDSRRNGKSRIETISQAFSDSDQLKSYGSMNVVYSVLFQEGWELLQPNSPSQENLQKSLVIFQFLSTTNFFDLESNRHLFSSFELYPSMKSLITQLFERKRFNEIERLQRFILFQTVIKIGSIEQISSLIYDIILHHVTERYKNYVPESGSPKFVGCFTKITFHLMNELNEFASEISCVIDRFAKAFSKACRKHLTRNDFEMSLIQASDHGYIVATLLLCYYSRRGLITSLQEASLLKYSKKLREHSIPF